MPEDRGNGITAWLDRAGPLLDLVNKIGFTAFLLIVIGLGIWWAHTVMLAQTEALGKITILLRRIDRRAQLIDCAQLNDLDLRARCLDDE